MPEPLANIYRAPDAPHTEESIEPLVEGGRFRVERIVSTGQTTPEGEWFEQDGAEWVVLLTGGARLRFEDPNEVIELAPGDYVNIPARRRHRVEWTDRNVPTVWLAIHYEA